MSKAQYIKAEAEFIKLFGIRKGSKVIILRQCKSREVGWNNSWDTPMNDYIGKEVKVERICDNGTGIMVNPFVGAKNDFDYKFPFFALQPVPRENVTIKLDSGDYTAIINFDGSIQVGCQSISFETLEKIYKTALEERGL